MASGSSRKFDFSNHPIVKDPAIAYRSFLAFTVDRKGGVDGEPDHRDQAEEAVEEQQEERDDQQADQRGGLRLFEGVLPERRRYLRLLELVERHR